MSEPKDLGLSYVAACHAMQSGVAYEMNARAGGGASPKDLRVGINSSMVTDAAIVSLLIAKGVFTHDEFMGELRLQMNLEASRYEIRANEAAGAKPGTITFR